jgi:hypothetical protein
MAPTSVSTLAARCSIVVVLALGVFALEAQAQIRAGAISGAYSGSDNCPEPRKLKFTLQASSDGSLSGLITFYLPHTATKAVSYFLNGRYDVRSGEFSLVANGWKDAPPPAGFVMSGMDGTLNPRKETIEGKLTTGACTAFTAWKDPEGAATVTNVINTGLVHKSKTFWKSFKGDLIREVFDGDFGKHVGESTDFQLLFTDYVEAYSKRCRASLPVKHVTLTYTQGVGSNLVTGKIEMDARFEEPYRAYYGTATSTMGTALSLIITKGPERLLKDFTEPSDTDQFFGRASCQSASMRQLGENLLRAAKSQPSLQREGATIPGAAAETRESQLAEEAGTKAEEAERLAEAEKVRQKRAADPVWIRYEKEQQEKWGTPRVSVGDYTSLWKGKQMHLSGTVARVSVATGTPSWLSMRFSESPNDAFVVCSPSPSIFTGLLGNDLNDLIGKRVEVIGYVESPLCGGVGGSIRVVSSDSIRLLP